MDSSTIRLASIGKPGSLSELAATIQLQNERKRQLAEKVMKVKGLTKEEKQEIYNLLTNDDPPPVKKGRPSKCMRDMAFAYDYLKAKYNGKWVGIESIATKHKIKINDHTTIYKALDRGLKALEDDSKEAQQSANNMLAYIKEGSRLYPHLMLMATEAEYKLILLELHKLQKVLVSLTGKNRVPINSLE